MIGINVPKAERTFAQEIRRLTMYEGGSYATRWQLDWEWFRNFLFAAGVQWFYHTPLTTTLRKLNIPEYVPRPITNRFRQYLEVLVALLARVEPNILVFPAEEKDEDIMTSEIAWKIIKALEVENDVQDIRLRIARLLALTGNAFTYCGTEEVNTIQSMQQRESLHEYQKKLAQMPEGEEKTTFAAQLDQLTMQMQSQKRMRFYTDVYSPFEVFANLSVESIENQPAIAVIQLMDVDQIKNVYGVEATPSTVSEIQSLTFLNAIPFISNDMLTAGNGLFGYRNDMRQNAYVKRLFKRPTREYPSGLIVTLVNDQVVEGPLDLPVDEEGQAIIPMTHIKFDPVPHAFFGRSPMVQVIPKQQSRNRWESLLEMVEMRCGYPNWIKTAGTTMSQQDTEPNSVITWTAVGDKATAPIRTQGVPLDRGAVTYMQSFDQEIGDLISIVDVMLGKTMPAGSPAALADLLVQQGMTRFGPILNALAHKQWKMWAKYQLILFRQYGNKTRTYRVLDDQGVLQMQTFSNADLTGGIHLNIENNSVMPKSDIISAAQMDVAIKANLLDLKDPKVRYRGLKKLNLNDMISETDQNYKRAALENKMILMGQPVEANPYLDAFEIHIPCHQRAANESNRTPEERMRFSQHILDHFMKRDMLLAAQSVPVTPGSTPRPEETPQSNQQ